MEHHEHDHKPDMFPQLKEEGEVPWDAIHRFAGHLPEKAELFADVLARVDSMITEDPWEEMDLEFVYLCAVLALAAPNLSPAQREEALGILRKGVSDELAWGDISEDAVRSALAAFDEPGCQESRPVRRSCAFWPIPGKTTTAR